MGNCTNNNSKSDDTTYDNNNDVVSSISKTNDGFGGASTGFKKAGGSYRITHNGSFSPKHYKSGWGGGSRGKIKTYNSVKTGGALSKVATPIGIGISAYNVYDAYKNDGNSIGNNTKKAVVSEAGSWAGGIGGAASGAAIGSAICPGVGTVTGAIIGGIAGGYGGGKGGEKIGEKLFDK